ncbi:BON domain-containing protein [Legionella lytica]|jgi:osmotically-inducible protein OsmY|uniref:BON domain-containing protein n=1 Tax=Legionella lytica TaxID=96232 RepID=A0ABY4Y895_9GAMM|nr:BON domain-containing protein [Legionella lytica]USQ13744.1 BON domain-containing protein [Legionella lytica]
MLKQGCLQILVIFTLWCLSSCSSIWTGANLVYDRHDVYKKLDDYRLYVKVNNAITVDKLFKDSRSPLDIAVFNGDILVAGHVPTQSMHTELQRRLNTVQGARRVFNEVRVDTNPPNSMEDNWITTKIRSQIFADASIDPNAFKVVTSDGIVYLMGDVRPDEAATVINFTRHTAGVRHVVKVLKYLVYQK